MPDSDGVDWQQLAERVSARQRGRDSLIRGVAVVGDYARNQVWEGSLLQIVLFRHRSEALIDEGGVVEENGVSVAIDSITSGSLVELEELLHLEPLAGNLADMHTLRMADQTLRDVLATFRDRYHSADGRQLRARRALQRARVALDDYESGRASDRCDRGPALGHFPGRQRSGWRTGRLPAAAASRACGRPSDPSAEPMDGDRRRAGAGERGA